MSRATAPHVRVDYEMRREGAGVLLEGLDAQEVDAPLRAVTNARDLVTCLPHARHGVRVPIGPAEASSLNP